MPSIRDLFKKTNTQTGLGAGLNLNTWDNSGTFTTGVAFDGNDSKFIVPKVTTAVRTATTPLQGELVYDTDLDKFFYGDGVTVGGVEVGSGSGSGHTIEDEGTPLTQRTKLNFVGTGVTVTDDSVNDETVVTINSTGGDISIIDIYRYTGGF